MFTAVMLLTSIAFPSVASAIPASAPALRVPVTGSVIAVIERGVGAVVGGVRERQEDNNGLHA